MADREPLLRPHRKLLYFMLQQVEQLASSQEDYLLQFENPQDIDEIENEFKQAVLQILAPEERLQGLAPEDRLKGLSKEQFSELRQMIDRKEANSDSESENQ